MPKKSVVAWVLLPRADATVEKHLQTFGTTTAEILALLEWLRGLAVTHLVLESTGVSWWPIYQWLEGHLHLPVANPAHGKALPGRKTDQTDPEWPADLPRHGLIRGRFGPPRPQRELRELTRHRLSLRGVRSRALNESERTLEGTNLKLSSVGRELQGVSARLILQALVAGPSDPQALAGLAQGRLRQKKVALAAARRGVGREPHRLILGQWLADLALCDEQIEAGSVATAQRVQSHAEWIARLDGVPGIDRKVAEVILAGLGPDPARLGSAERAASWAGWCPGNHQSGGRRHRGRSRQGDRALKTTMVQAGHVAGRTKDSSFGAKHRRVAARRGRKRAALAVGPGLDKVCFHLIARGPRDQDLGADSFDQRDPEAVTRRLVKRLKKLGYEVSLKKADEPARGRGARRPRARRGPRPWCRRPEAVAVGSAEVLSFPTMKPP